MWTEIGSKGQKERTGGEEDNTNNTRYPWTESVEGGSNRKCADIRANSSNRKHEVQPQFLLVAYPDLFVQLLLGAFIPINPLGDEHWFDGGESKDNTGSEQVVQDSDSDLGDPLSLADLKSADWISLRGRRYPFVDWMERELSALRASG